jgi:hypothetical protein
MRSLICWVISGASILGSLAWIAFSSDKALGILFGIVAIVLSRILLGDVMSTSEKDNTAEDTTDHSRSGPRD